MSDEGRRSALGSRLKIERTTATLTQEELAKRSGLSRNTVAQIEAGLIAPNIVTVWRLADGLGMTMAHFLRPDGMPALDDGGIPAADELAALERVGDVLKTSVGSTVTVDRGDLRTVLRFVDRLTPRRQW